LGIADHLSPLLKTDTSQSAYDLKSVISREDRLITVPQNNSATKASPSLKTLMKRARAHKRAGDWQAAVAAYENVERLYPKSNDARTSQVSMGQLYLDKLNQPSQALRHFNAYLKHGATGALAQEAMYGKAAALRKLGQRAAERDALNSLLAQYPDGFHAGLAQKRLRQLGLPVGDTSISHP